MRKKEIDAERKLEPMIDTKLKPLDFDGKMLYYWVEFKYHPYGDWEITHFYFTNDKSKIEWKLPGLQFLGFTDTKRVPSNKEVFELDYDIESFFYTKKQVRKDIQRKMDLVERVKEIAKGQII